MGSSRQEYWSGLLCPLPGDLPDPGIESWSPALQAGSLPSEPPEKPSIQQGYIGASKAGRTQTGIRGGGGDLGPLIPAQQEPQVGGGQCLPHPAWRGSPSSGRPPPYTPLFQNTPSLLQPREYLPESRKAQQTALQGAPHREYPGKCFEAAVLPCKAHLRHQQSGKGGKANQLTLGQGGRRLGRREEERKVNQQGEI